MGKLCNKLTRVNAVPTASKRWVHQGLTMAPFDTIIALSLIRGENKVDKKTASVCSLLAHLNAFRNQRNDMQKNLVSELALNLQEVMVRGAIKSCRENGVPEENILGVLGEDAYLATGGTRIESIIITTTGGSIIQRKV